jgi:hypothetical protein
MDQTQESQQVEKVVVQEKKRGIRLRDIIIAGCVLLISVPLIVCILTSSLCKGGSSIPESTTSTVTEEEVEKYTEAEAKEKFITFYKELDSFFSEDDTAKESIQNASSDYAGYLIAMEQKEYYRSCLIKNSLSDSASYPGKIPEKMDELKDILKDYCFETEYGFDHLAKYLDTGEFSEMDNATLYFQTASGYEVDALVPLMDIATSLGVEAEDL